MAIVSTIGTGLGAIDSVLGGRLGGVVDSINPFKRSEPNAGSSSFVDAIDNYEKISTSKARSILPKFTNKIAAGATDFQLAEFIASAAGEPGKGSAYKSSWKWEILQNWIDQSRSIQDEQRENNTSFLPGSGGESAGGSGGGGFNKGYLIGGAIVSILATALIIKRF